MRRRNRRRPSNAVPCSGVGHIQSGAVFHPGTSFSERHHADCTRPANRGSKFDQHAARRACSRVPHRLARRRRSAFQSRQIRMFCDASPIWRFLTALGAEENPERARKADGGLHVMEVFPALALASLDTRFFGRLRGPRYNPDRKKTFLIADWGHVAEAAAREAQSLRCGKLAEWCYTAGEVIQPQKADQDKLDSVLCALIALNWRLRRREASLLLGDGKTGYMVVPASKEVREYLITPARRHMVPIDGAVPPDTIGHSGVP